MASTTKTRFVHALVAAAVMVCCGAAMAQRGVELGVIGGYVWTDSRSVYYGVNEGARVDFESSPVWGLSLDITFRPAQQLRLLYTRQDTNLIAHFGGTSLEFAEADVEYWQIGGLRGIIRGQVMPYSAFTLGATRFMFSGTQDSDDWRFSMVPSVGVKVYGNERIGFCADVRLPVSIVDGGAGVGCGPGGCATTVGGEGILQCQLTGSVFGRF